MNNFVMPNAAEVARKRGNHWKAIASNSNTRRAFLQVYKNNPVAFIEDWFVTHDPRRNPSLIPFILFPKQKEFINWLHDKYVIKSDGLVEKSRDAGATWLCMAFSIWMWRFVDGSKIGFGSRKGNLVDKLGDPDSIFEKGRLILQYLPKELLPEGFNLERDAPYMKIINRQTGSAIVGEAGDNIGRGGRSTMYFKDESAFYERPEKIEAALSQNSDVKIDISTPNGNGNPFYKKRFSGSIPIFTFHWRDDPRKDDAWYKKQVETLDPVTVAQEIDIDYSASVEGICIPAKWVKAAVNFKIEPTGKKEAGLDVGEEDGDNCALIMKHGVVVMDNISEWNDSNTTQSARRAYRLCGENNIEKLKYDSIGVGAGIKGETAELQKLSKIKIKVLGVNVGLPPTKGFFEKGKKNKDMFVSYKAQLYWEMRRRFQRTYEHVNGIKTHPLDELISIPNHAELIAELSVTKVSENEAGKIVIESKKQLKKRGIKSPNLAESLIILFARGKLTTTDILAKRGKR